MLFEANPHRPIGDCGKPVPALQPATVNLPLSDSYHMLAVFKEAKRAKTPALFSLEAEVVAHLHYSCPAGPSLVFLECKHDFVRLLAISIFTMH